MTPKKQIIINTAGDYWAPLLAANTNEFMSALCITPMGRIITARASKTVEGSSGSSSKSTTYAGTGLWYSDDNGTTWHLSNKKDGNWAVLCVTPTGRIIAGNNNYKTSENNVTGGHTTTVTYNGTGIWYSDDNGATWIQSNKTDGNWKTLCVTPTGRIIAAGVAGGTTVGSGNYVTSTTFSGRIGIWYSDDNGATWIQSNKTDGNWKTLCVTPTGRILAGGISDDRYQNGSGVVSGVVSTYTGIWCSDDNGVNWIQLRTVNNSSLCITPTGRIFAGSANSNGRVYSDDNGATWTVFTFPVTGSMSILCATPTGRIIAGDYYGNIEYSDDDGVTWNLSRFNSSGNVNSSMMWYSIYLKDQQVLIGGEPGIYTSYTYTVSNSPVTGEQAKEFVRQFKAFVQSFKS